MTTTFVPATLAHRVSAHMTVTFPEVATAGGWTVAADTRDGTAAVVWQPGTEPMPPRVRGMLLYGWLCSLRDAGFTGDARVDMSVFGRPVDSPDGVARWLHVTGWAAPEVTVTAPLPPLPPKVPQCVVPLPAGHGLRCPLSGLVPQEVQFTYRTSGVETVLIYETPDFSWGQLETRPPAWLASLAEQHRPGVSV